MGCREKRGAVNPNIMKDPEGAVLVDSPFIGIKKAGDFHLLSLLGILLLSLFGIIKQVYLSKIFPTHLYPCTSRLGLCEQNPT